MTITAKPTPWTKFYDMHSGGDAKVAEAVSAVYIHAPKELAIRVFFGLFKRDPRNEVDWPHPEPRGQFELVTCTDVLEHVERDMVPAVLADIAAMLNPTYGRLFLAVSIQPAKAILPPCAGLPHRNAHITVEPLDWWLPRLTAAGLKTTMADLTMRWSHFFGWWRKAT